MIINKLCFRCNNEYDITYYTNKNKVYKICKLCRNKNNNILCKKKHNKMVEIEKALDTLNYMVCNFNRHIYKNSIIQYSQSFFKSMIQNRQVILIPNENIILVPLSNNSIMYIPIDTINIYFLSIIECSKTCDICFEKKKHFLKCDRCNNTCCSDCYKKSNLYCCMFCRYTLEDHLNNNINGQYLNLLKIEDALFHLRSRAIYRTNKT